MQEVTQHYMRHIVNISLKLVEFILVAGLQSYPTFISAFYL